MPELRVDLGAWDLLVVEALIDALDQLDDPEPLVRTLIATWKCQILLDAQKADA